MTPSLTLRLKRRIRGTTAHRVISEVRRALRDARALDTRVASLKQDRPARGRVLLSYITRPFFLARGQTVSTAHTQDWESIQMAKTFLDLGYDVDVIHYNNSSFIPRREYSFLIDSRFNLERLASLLNRDCVRIMHADTAHVLFHNAGEANRLLELGERRGICIQPRRVMRHNLGIEHAHCATVLGNEFTLGTYKYANKRLYRLPISTPALYPWPGEKNFDSIRRNFLWFGSGGFVHKGLDLVLEAFAKMPDFHLTICGPIGGNSLEKDFERAFQRELYQLPNIHTVGWTDVASQHFVQIANNCLGLIYPSCSEGQCGGVITCMHAGIIPLVSQETGVDVATDFGVVLEDCSVGTIEQCIRSLSEKPASQLRSMARAAWEFAREHHTKEAFAAEYSRAAVEITSGTWQRPAS